MFTKTFSYCFTGIMIFSQVTNLVRPAYLDSKKPTANTEITISAPEKVPSNTNAEISIENINGHIQVKSQLDLFNRAKVYEVVSNEQGKKKYVFTGPNGKYLVTVITFNEKSGLKEETLVVKIGEDVNPEPVIPTPQPNNPPIVDPINIQDKWGISNIIKTELDKINNLNTESINKLGAIYDKVAEEFKGGSISSANLAYSKINEITTREIVLLSDRQNLSAMNLALNNKLKENWNKMVVDRNEFYLWLKTVGKNLLEYKNNQPITIKPKSISVLMLYESGDLTKREMKDINNAVFSTKIRSYLKNAKYSFYIDDDDINPADPKWKSAVLQVNNLSIPLVAIFDENNKLVAYAKIENEEQVLNLIKKYGDK